LAHLQKYRNLPKLSALILVLIQAAHAENSEFDGLEDTYGNEKMLSIATGHPIQQNLSPSVTSIMTSHDIEQIGARRLQDVLEYLPGVHVSTARSGNTVIGFRGIYSETNSQVLLLINGIPLRNTAIGGKPSNWTMPVKNISHIEVIRGPGSMLYGGDATTGVINVVLKSGKELSGVYTGAFIGSQDTYEGWAQYGQKTENWEYSFSAQGGTSDGSRKLIEQDGQSFLDHLFGTQVSNAPGLTNFGRNDVDARIDIAYKDWLRLRTGYQGFHDVQTGEGGALALDNQGITNENIYNLDLSIKPIATDDLGSRH
jgi:outer membrane receptor for ferrienterochelin and colicin